LNLPEGTATSFYVPTIQGFQQVFDFTCNCINKWGDWRLTNLRNGGRENFDVSEMDTAAYLQLDWNLDLFGAPFRGNVGSRMVTTDVTSNGRTTAGRPLVGKNNYTDWLPSMNLVYEPIHNMLFRFGMSKVMARPLLGNLSPTITAVTIPNTGDQAATGSLTIGNPKLKPFYSTNTDASIEWYFRKGSLISLALFNKKIQSFPQTVSISGPLSTFLDQESRDALLAQFTNQNQINFINNDGTVVARQFRDAPGGYLRGFEANLQVDLDFLPGFLDGFGVLLNYTYIKSKLKYIIDPGTAATATSPAVAATFGSAPFLNVSPRALNGTLYYEKGPFKARVSVAHRKGYSTTYPLASGTCAPGILSQTANGIATYCGSPLINDFVFSGATTNVDFSASYQVTKFFSVTAEGLNLTNQTSNRYAYSENPVVTQYASSGPTYRVGARLKF
jgi:TonB-dependent receptor